METDVSHETIYWKVDTSAFLNLQLIREEPLSIRVQGTPYSVVMRTPEEEVPLAAGHCLTEGIVERPDDILSIGFCNESDTNEVDVTLNQAANDRIAGALERRLFVSQTGCGICGKELIEDISRFARPLKAGNAIEIRKALSSLETFSKSQDLFLKTRASHAAAIYNRDYDLLAISEDVGRHNALDKAIGTLFLKRELERAAFVILSSRISYELVQKAARAGIPIMLSISRPTAFAVDLAKALNLTLACLAENAGVFVFCGKDRLK